MKGIGRALVPAHVIASIREDDRVHEHSLDTVDFGDDFEDTTRNPLSG